MRIILLSVLLLVTLSALAVVPLTFEEVDTDGDGLVSADEAASVEGLDFNAADGDNDGTLSVDEYDIAVESLPQPAAAQSPVEAAPPFQPSPTLAPASPASPATPSKP
jgi:hypothetical protein